MDEFELKPNSNKYKEEQKKLNSTPERQKLEKIVKGQGHGSNPRSKERYHLLKGKNGTKKWISHNKYQECIIAKNNGTLTKRQKEVLDSAHWND